MDKVLKLDPLQPRFLRYRGHYKIYVLCLSVVSLLLVTFWSFKFVEEGAAVLKYQSTELFFSFLYFAVIASFYTFWLRSKLNRSVQVFPDYILVHNGKVKEVIPYAEIESLNVVCWSIFYVKMKNGFKFYFNSGLERVDYIWEGIYNNRPDLIDQKEFESYRLKLVQYDHHQKRKEWFFKHKMVDLFNWIALPVFFLMCAYFVQSRSVNIHQQGLYFFRLFMFSLLVLLTSAFVYSIFVKKFIFDKKLAQSEGLDKVRDTEFEGVVIQRSKVFQLLTSCFLLALIVKTDMNFYSVSKVKDDVASFNMKKGNTIVVDNRYNCVACKYELKDGDLVLFGRGIIGQVLAKEGDMVGEVSNDTQGRSIASENVQVVPRGHVAIKSSNGKDIMFIQIQDLIGKIQN